MSLKKINNPLHTLILCGILLIPFMSLPVMPSDYRPVSVFFLVPISIYIYFSRLVNFGLTKDVLVLSLFFLFAIVQSLILQSFTVSLRAIMPLLFGFFSYVGISYYFQKNRVINTFNHLTKIFSIIAIIGIVEVLSMREILPFYFKEFIGEVFSAKVSSRLQLVSMEGSWAAKIIIFSIPIFIFQYCLNGKFHMSFYILLILFFLIFSIEGFAILVTAFIFRFFPVLIKTMTFRYKFKYYLFTFFSFLAISTIIQNVLSNQQGYQIDRLYQFVNANSFLTILSLDASTFIRVVYPYIGFLIFWDNPLGVGLGGYAENFNYYIKKIPVQYSSFEEVVGDIITKTADPKNLYSKIASEIGIVGIVLFISFLLLQLKYLRYNIISLPKYKLFFMSNFLLGLTCVIQFGSFAYLPFWFAFGINSAIYFKVRKGFDL